jgi:hypothetical protein
MIGIVLFAVGVVDVVAEVERGRSAMLGAGVEVRSST